MRLLVMPAPCGGIHPLALIGAAPEHRDHRAEESGAEHLQPMIDETALIEAFVNVDAGCTRPTRVGKRTWLMKKVYVAHDVVIGDDCEIAALTAIGGYCEIGNGVRIGLGASLRPYVRVGDGARIGAGAVVVSDIPPGEVWAGNPARFLRRVREDEILRRAKPDR